MFTIRPHRYDDRDFTAQLALHHLLWPEYPLSMTEHRHSIEASVADSTCFCERFAVENSDGEAVAFFTCREKPDIYSPGAYWMDIRVHPAWQRRGIGARAYEHIVSALSARVQPPLQSLFCATRDDRHHSARFLERRGFEPRLHTNSSELAVNAFDTGAYTPLLERLAREGVRFVSGAELEAEGRDTWRRELWALHQVLMADVPAVVPHTPVPYEEYEKSVLKHPTFRADACFLALDEERLAGMSYLALRSEKPEELETEMTGVLREYRRRGIATALKVKSVEFARGYGAATIMTMNEENNPMYGLNVRLGFRPLPSWITFVREFTQSD